MSIGDRLKALEQRVEAQARRETTFDLDRLEPAQVVRLHEIAEQVGGMGNDLTLIDDDTLLEYEKLLTLATVK